MVPLDLVVGELRNGFPFDLEDDAVGHEMRVHPVEREALLDVEGVIRVLVEDDLREEAVDGHHRGLPGYRDAAVGQLGQDFAGLQLAGLGATLRVDAVLLEAAAEILRSRSLDLTVRVESAKTGFDESRVSLLNEESVETDPVVAGRILGSESGNVIRQLDRRESGRFKAGWTFDEAIERLDQGGGVAVARRAQLLLEVCGEGIGSRRNPGLQGGRVLEIVRLEVGGARPTFLLDGIAHGRHPAVDGRHQAGGKVGPSPGDGDRIIQRGVEERRILLGTPVVVSPDVVEVRIVREGVLGDQVDVPSVEPGIATVLRRNETLAEDHVRRAEAAWIRAAEEHGVLVHRRIERLAVLALGGRCCGGVRTRFKHVVAEPEPEVVVPLLVVCPVIDDRVGWNQREQGKHQPQTGSARRIDWKRR